MTLVEMIVVLAIVALLMGLAIGFVSESGKDVGIRAAIGQLRTLVRHARSMSVSRHAPCEIRIDPDKASFTLLTRQTLGLWHFEDLLPGEKKKEQLTSGAFGQNATVTKGILVRGRLGNALQFEAKNKSYADCGVINLDPKSRGLWLSVWIRSRSKGKEQVILLKEKDYGLSLTRKGHAKAFIGELELEAESVSVPEGRWTQLLLFYEGGDGVLWMNDRIVAKGTLRYDRRGKLKDVPPLEPHDTALTISSKRKPFDGTIDEVWLAALLPEREATLPYDVEFTGESARLRVRRSNGEVVSGLFDPAASNEENLVLQVEEGKAIEISRKKIVDVRGQLIRFDERGQLDRDCHSEPPRIQFAASDEEEPVTLRIGWMGTVE